MSNRPNLVRFRNKQKLPKPPKHLRPTTRKWFADVVSSYELEPHHVRLLTLAAESWDRIQEAREAIAQSGLTYVNKAGEPRRHPAVQIEHDSKIAFARLLRELALDISAPDDSRPPALGGR